MAMSIFLARPSGCGTFRGMQIVSLCVVWLSTVLLLDYALGHAETSADVAMARTDMERFQRELHELREELVTNGTQDFIGPGNNQQPTGECK